MINLPTPKDLKRYRKMIGLTQQELAERASVSQSLIARIEAGTVDPRISTVGRILRVIRNTQQKELKAINVAVTQVITLQEAELVSTASKLMFTNGFSQIPVCNDKGHVIGSLKEKTITKSLIEKGIEILSQPISEIMKKDDALPMLPISSSLKSVEDLLVHHGHSAVLLMEEGEVVGILTKADVIRAYME